MISLAGSSLFVGVVPPWGQRGGTVTAASEAGGDLLASSLISADWGLAEIHRPWRSASALDTDTYVDFDLGQPRPVLTGVLANHNGTAEATCRLVGSSNTLPSPTVVPPDEVIVATNTGGTDVGLITGPMGVSGNGAIVIFVGGVLSIRFVLGKTPSAATDAQLFRMLMVSLAGDVSGVRVLDANGDPIGEPVIGAASTVYDFPWTAGGAFEVTIDNTAGTGGIAVEVVDWVADITTDTPADSGWHVMQRPAGGFGVDVDELVDDAPRLQTNVQILETAGQLVTHDLRYWRWQIRDIRNPDGYVQVGLADVGPGVGDLELGEGAKIGWADGSQEDSTARGVVHVEPGPTWLEAELPFTAPADRALYEVGSALFGQLRGAAPFAIAIQPGVGQYADVLSIWGKLQAQRSRSVTQKRGIDAKTGQPVWSGDLRVREIR